MKITCQSCQAKYSIADEKVVGKTVKIKCKKCGATIVVNGSEAQAAPVAAAHPAGMNGHAPQQEEENEGETRVFSESASNGASGGEEWTVNVTDEDQRTMSTPQIVSEYLRGTLTNDSYVWRDGMADWQPLSDVPELMTLVSRGRASAPPPAAPAPAPFSPSPFQPPAMMAAPSIEEAPPPKAAAVKKAGRAPAVDLFGTNNELPSSLPSAGGGLSAASANAAADKMAGERNENSVLFSLSALTATENAARAQPKDPPVVDLRPGAPPRPSQSQNGGRGNIDDIMNLGGGMSAPLLAPPPLLAPVIEPPPPPPPPPVAAMPMGAQPYSMAPAMAQPKKSSTGMLVGAFVGLLAIGGVLAFFLTRGPATPPPVATGDHGNTSTTTTPTATAAPPDTATAAPPDTTAANTPPPTDTSQPTSTATAKPTGAVATNNNNNNTSKPVDKPVDKPTPTPTAVATAAPTAKPADTPPPSGGGREFDRAAASAALAGAAGAAKGCKKADGPTGSGRVKVTFAPSGNVTSSTVDGAPFAGTSVGGCVASAFRGAHVPPFDGSPVSVSKSFSIN